MAGVRITFGTGLQNFTSLINSTSRRVQTKVDNIIKTEVNAILKELKQNSPAKFVTRTDTLRLGWKKRPISRNRYMIFNDVGYASHLEYGTKRGIRARRMLRSAIQRAQYRIKRRLKKLDRQIERNFDRGF